MGQSITDRKARAPRFRLGQTVYLFLRSQGSRACMFEMRVINISRDGLLIEADNAIVVPFETGVEIAITLDISCQLFSHPIVVYGKIVRRSNLIPTVDNESHTRFGIEFLSIEDSHKKAFDQGLREIGDSGQDEY